MEAGSSPDTRQARGSAQISGRGAALHCSLRPIRLAPSLAANPASPPPSTQHACPPSHPPTAGPHHLPRTPVLGRLVTPQVPPLAQRLRADVMLRAGRCGRSCKSAGPDLVSKEPARRATLVLGPAAHCAHAFFCMVDIIFHYPFLGAMGDHPKSKSSSVCGCGGVCASQAVFLLQENVERILQVASI